MAKINKYYAPRYRYWPLVNIEDPAAGRIVSEWLAHGITPGVVLPSSLRKLSTRDLARARKLEDSGAVFVLKTAPGQTDFGVAATDYAAIGLIIRTVFINRGYAPDLDALPPGTYLVDRHWKNRPALPIPRRPIEKADHTFIPMAAKRLQVSNVHDAKATFRRGMAYTPALDLSWHFAGMNFHVDSQGEHVTWRGMALQSVLGVIALVSLQFQIPIHSVTAHLLSVLSWLAIVVGLVSILILMIGVILGNRSNART